MIAPAMRAAPILGAMVLAAALLPGCAQPLTQNQLAAIETRIVDADRDRTYRSAAGALFDAGYVIHVSDVPGGILSAEHQVDNSMARALVHTAISDTHLQLSLHIKALAPGRTSVRVRTAVNGIPVVDKEAVDRIWILMQRQVILHEAWSPGEPPKAARAE
jgi:hypothetical protein